MDGEDREGEEIMEQELKQVEEPIEVPDEDVVEDDEVISGKPKAVGEFKLFDLYDVSDIKINDPGIKKYINIDPKLVVKSHGRIREKFSRAKVNLLELFANLIAVPGHRGKKHKIQTGWKSGKYSQNMKIVLNTLQLIEDRTKENPVQVLVTAIENAAPRDGVTVIEYGGARYPQAVDLSPMRRVTMTLRNIIQGSYDKSFNKKTKIEQALAEEIIKTYKNEDSHSLQKRKESEKQADSAR